MNAKTGNIQYMDVLDVPSAVTQDPNACRPPSLWQLFRVWFLLGAQSFGGGTATLFLIRRAIVERQRWLSDQEFVRTWAICQAAPGLNQLCLVILVGWRLRGAPGIVLTLAGLLLPSATITVLLTSLYVSVQALPVVQAALRGVLPATIGLGLLLSVQMARPLLVESKRESRTSLLLSCVLLVGSGLSALLWDVSLAAVLIAAGAVSGFARWRRLPRSEPQEERL